MMQQTIKLGDQLYVVGLEWDLISMDGHARKKDIKRITERTGVSFGITVEGIEDSVALGVGKKSPYPSAAAMLAAAHKKVLEHKNDSGLSGSDINWLIIQKVEVEGRSAKDLYWLCGVQNGILMPEADMVEELTVLQAKIIEILETLGQEEITFFSIDPEVLEFLHDTGKVVDASFSQLVKDLSGDIKPYKMKKIVGLPDWVMLAGAGSAFLVFGWMGWGWYSEKMEKEYQAAQKLKIKNEEQQKRLMEAQQKEMEYKTKYNQVLSGAVSDIEKSLGKNPKDVIEGWNKVIKSIPLNHGGWNISGIDCFSGRCEVTLNRDENVGTNKSLLNVIPSAKINGNVASYFIEIQEVKSNKEFNKENLFSDEMFTKDLVSAFQELKIRNVIGEASFSEMKEMMFRPPVNGVQNNGGVAVPEEQPLKMLGIKSGTLMIKGKDLFTLDLLEQEISKMHSTGMSLEGVSITFQGGNVTNAQWSIKGKMFIKGGTQEKNMATSIGSNGAVGLIDDRSVPHP